jgi:hypothetical protein
MLPSCCLVAAAAAVNSIVGLAVISSAVVPSCSQLLGGPYAESAPWQRLAAALDKAAGGVLKRSLQQPALAGAVCRTTGTSMQVRLQQHNRQQQQQQQELAGAVCCSGY